MLQVHKALIPFIAILCLLIPIDSHCKGIEYVIYNIDKEPVVINGIACEAGSKFFSGSAITSWGNCTYFKCRTVRKYDNKYRRFLITKADYTKVKRSSLGSYISTLKPLSGRGADELTNWLSREWYAINDGTGDTDLIFDLPFPETNSKYILSFYDNNGERHCYDLVPIEGSITIPMALFSDYISDDQNEFVVSIDFKAADGNTINLTEELRIIFLQ